MMTSRTRLISAVALTILVALVPFFAAPAQSNGAGAADAESDATVWGALVFAGDEAPESTAAKGADPIFAGVTERLGKVFTGRHFTLLGQHTQEIFREYESWVVPSKELFLKIDSKGPAPSGGMQLHIQLWHQTNVVVKTDAILKADSPLFIRGPAWRGGHLIFVVMLTAQRA